MLRQEPSPHERAQPIGADQAIAGRLQRDRAALDRDRDAVRPGREARDRRAGVNRDCVLARDRFKKRPLEIGPMGEKIGRPPPLLRAVERHGRNDPAIARAADLDRARREA